MLKITLEININIIIFAVAIITCNVFTFEKNKLELRDIERWVFL